MFSLCIPTVDRYDKFLKKYLPKYIENKLINEIVICDENGKDVEKIQRDFKSDKLKLYVNDNKLGPFLNKLKCCRLANNIWIALIDSDNFADYKYFEIANEYIRDVVTDEKTILAPSFAKPDFDFKHLSGLVYKKNNFNNNKNHEQKYNVELKQHSSVLMNTGNYILNKYIIENINIDNDSNLIKNSSACDVILFNTLVFEQIDCEMHVVPNLEYEHVVHPDSTYIKEHKQTQSCIDTVHNRYYKLI